jgi:hypothetical protein
MSNDIYLPNFPLYTLIKGGANSEAFHAFRRACGFKVVPYSFSQV